MGCNAYSSGERLEIKQLRRKSDGAIDESFELCQTFFHGLVMRKLEESTLGVVVKRRCKA